MKGFYWDVSKNVICKLSDILHKPQYVNLLWPSDAIWWYRSVSTLAQAMTWCHQWLVAWRHQVHYLKQSWLIITKVPWHSLHYHDVTMDSIASQITSLTIVYSAVYSAADQRKHQSSASLAFVRGIHRGPVNSPHKGPVTRKMFPFDDVIMRGHYHVEIWRCQ